MNLFTWIPAAVILLLALYCRRRQGSWLHPACFFSLVWAGNTLTPLVVVPDFKVSFTATGSILLACGLVAWGSLIGSSPAAAPADQSRGEWPALSLLCSLGGLAGLIAAIVFFREYGIGLTHFLSLDGLKGLPGVLYRSINVQTPPLLTRCFLLPSYAGVLFSGVLLSRSRPARAKFWAFLPFIPLLVIAVVEGRRARLLVPLFLCLSTYLACRAGDGTNKKDWKSLRKTFVGAALGLGLFGIFTMGIQTSRKGLSWDHLKSSWQHSRGSLFGHLSGFSQWLGAKGSEWNAPKWGVHTFAGVFHFIGIKERAIGLYNDFVVLGAPPHETSTNVYTVFRGLIEDFSLPGAGIFLFVLGWIAGKAYQMVVSGKLWARAILGAFYQFTLWSPIASFAAYNIPPVAFGLLFLYLVFLDWRN